MEPIEQQQPTAEQVAQEAQRKIALLQEEHAAQIAGLTGKLVDTKDQLGIAQAVNQQLVEKLREYQAAEADLEAESSEG